MNASMLLTGLNGALGLYSGVKGMFDSASAASRQKRLHSMAKAEEDGWYRRNYYGHFLDNSASRAAIKRLEESLRRQNQQNRAYGTIHGATPEYTLARNRQNLQVAEEFMTNLASREDERKMRIDAIHRQNRNALLDNEARMASADEKNAASLAGNGFNLLQRALLGVEWGKEKQKK